MDKRTILSVFIIVASFLCVGAQSLMSFENIGIEKGLSNGYVRDIAIDHYGFVWVATENGLNRICGDRSINMKWKSKLFDNKTLTCLFFEPQHKKMWIGSHRGIVIYDCVAQSFTKLGQEDGVIGRDVANFVKASDDGLWITYADGKIQHLDVRNNSFTNYDYCQLTGNKGPLFSCSDDGYGHLFVCTSDEGLVLIDLNTKKVKKFTHHEDDPNSIPSNQTRHVFIDHQKNIWIGTKNGLSLFDWQTEKFRNFHHVPGDDTTLCGDNIFYLTEFDNHELWITSDYGGISVLDLDKHRPSIDTDIVFKNITDNNSGLTSSCVRRVKQDAYGNYWIGCFGAGMDFIDAKPVMFHTFPFYKEKHETHEPRRIYGIKIDDNGHLWLGGECEVSEFADGRLLNVWRTDEYKSVVNTLEIDHNGLVWMGMNDMGIICLNPKSGQFIKIEKGFEKNDIHALYEDLNGKMWIGFDAGLYSYYNGEVREEVTYNRQMDTRSIFSLAFDKQEKLWIGTGERGVYVFDKHGKMMYHFTHNKGFPSNNINHIYIDKEGGVWIATYNGLVYIVDSRQPEKFTVYDNSHGLRNKHIRAVQQDKNGNIWVSTYTNIACFNIGKQKFYNYDNNTPKGNYVEGGAARATDGTIYFTSPQGVCYFNPQDINAKQKVSPVHVIRVKGVSTIADNDSLVPFIPNMKGEIHLKHFQNTFNVLFAVENHSQEKDVEYRYKMDKLDDRWFDTFGTEEVTFHNLRAGKYVFRIQAKLKNQEWDDASEDQVTIIVNPPRWLSWWAKTLYALIILGLVAYYFQSYKRKLALKNSLQLARQESIQKEEMHEERLKFFTNVAHELRTPLTLIIGPLQNLVEDKRLPEVYHKKIEMINVSARRLQNLINDIMEFRKTETQNRKLCVVKGNLGSFVEKTGKHFKELNRNPKVSIGINVHPDVPEVYFDPEVITTVLSNLLSNAMKYTPEGKINVELSKEGDLVILAVTDTGYGIAKDALPHIFDRYYQAKGKHQASGTGIGLALAKSLAELHEAELTVESKQGKGSKFTFTINANNTYPNALHSEDEDGGISMQPTESHEAPPTSSDPTEDPRPLLLVVEDNDQIRQYISDSMGEAYRVTQAENGVKGISSAFEQIPDIIVSDIMMPEMDGIALTKTLKEDIRTSHIPIILLTAKDSIEDKEEGYDNGADSYLTKPFTANLLHSRITNLLNSRRRLAELMMLQNLSAQNITIGSKGTEPSQTTEGSPSLNQLDQEFMDKMNIVIKENLLKVDLDIAFMTDKMAMSHSTFYRKVKALTGMTANEYIRKMKLKHSMELLQSGEYNVTEAAMMAGFNNMGHFRESFKKEFGINPSDLLKK